MLHFLDAFRTLFVHGERLFLCLKLRHRKGQCAMDMKKLCDKLIEDETLKDVPLTIVFRVVLSVFSLIESGECFYENE